MSFTVSFSPYYNYEISVFNSDNSALSYSTSLVTSPKSVLTNESDYFSSSGTVVSGVANILSVSWLIFIDFSFEISNLGIGIVTAICEIFFFPSLVLKSSGYASPYYLASKTDKAETNEEWNSSSGRNSVTAVGGRLGNFQKGSPFFIY